MYQLKGPFLHLNVIYEEVRTKSRPLSPQPRSILTAQRSHLYQEWDLPEIVL